MTRQHAGFGPRLAALPIGAGLRPLRSIRFGADALAGLTLAALAVPEVLGYAKIAGMPVVTGLYTMLVPLAVFAVLGASRHLVVGADSATAAMSAAGLAGLAAPGSPRFVQLAGTAALLAGALLLLARLIRLGFLANFLSRTVLIGFLTGVGVQVAVGQLPEMLGLPAVSGGTVSKLVATVRGIPSVQPVTVLVSAAVIVLVVGIRLVNRRIPGALIAVVAAIAVSRLADLAGHGVTILGHVPQGLPHLALPSLSPADLAALLPTAASLFVVILAQSSATSRAYAAKYDETVDEDVDLVGLGAANVAAAVTGAFVVNGSPTKTEIVDGAGGRSQFAQLVTGVVVLAVLVFLTAPLVYLPLAALATVVFLIGVELIDVPGMRRILAVRPIEFGVALLTAAAVVFIGVEQGVVLAIVASIAEHLRHSYQPNSTVLRKSARGHWQAFPAEPGIRAADGLLVYRFGASLYFANAARLLTDVGRLTRQGDHVRWFCLDCAAIGDIDYTASAVLARVQRRLADAGTRLVLANVIEPVRAELDRYGVTAAVGTDAFFDTAGAVLEAYQSAAPERGRPHEPTQNKPTEDGDEKG